jgi:hypothetical protein
MIWYDAYKGCQSHILEAIFFDGASLHYDVGENTLIGNNPHGLAVDKVLLGHASPLFLVLVVSLLTCPALVVATPTFFLFLSRLLTPHTQP